MALRNRTQQGDDYGGTPPPPAGTGTGGPKPAGAQGVGAPIGVPEGYRAQGPPRTITDMSIRAAEQYGGKGLPTVGHRPLYYDGAEVLPGGLSMGEIVDLQTQLAKAGFLNTNFSKGVWDQATQAAYRDLLSLANTKGQTAMQTLQEIVAQGGDKGLAYTVDEFGNIVPVTSADRPPLVKQISDPNELELVFRTVLTEQLGQAWSREKVQGMVSAYQQMESQRQQEAYDKELTGGSVVMLPSPEAYATSEALRRDPQGVALANFEDIAGQTMDMLSSPAWGLS